MDNLCNFQFENNAKSAATSNKQRDFHEIQFLLEQSKNSIRPEHISLRMINEAVMKALAYYSVHFEYFISENKNRNLIY
jgi:hypothetical protein